MQLNITVEMTDEIKGLVRFVEHRLYVARTMIPEGYESYFQEQARYLSAHTSTAIEGNTISDEAAMLVLVEGAESESPAAMEKVNLEGAYKLMGELSSDKSTKIDEGIIRTINSLTLKGLPDETARNRGKYRPGTSLILDATTREVRYRPPPPAYVSSLMADLVTSISRWMEEYPGPVAAALAHFGLISVHPFEDGNGRTARLIADMILDLADWSAGGTLSVSKELLDRRADYNAILRKTQGEDYAEEVDATPFVSFHMEALSEAAARLEGKVIQFNKRRDEMVRLVKGTLSTRQVTGIMFILDVGPLSSTVYANMTETSQATALSDLSQLIEYEILVREGAGPSTRYRLAPRMAQIGEGDE